MPSSICLGHYVHRGSNHASQVLHLLIHITEVVLPIPLLFPNLTQVAQSLLVPFLCCRCPVSLNTPMSRPPSFRPCLDAQLMHQAPPHVHSDKNKWVGKRWSLLCSVTTKSPGLNTCSHQGNFARVDRVGADNPCQYPDCLVTVLPAHGVPQTCPAGQVEVASGVKASAAVAVSRENVPSMDHFTAVFPNIGNA